MGKRIKKPTIWLYILLAIFIITTIVWYINDGFLEKKLRTKIDIQEHELDIVYGSDSADLTIFLFSNYSCSFCRKFFAFVYPKLKEEYIDHGKIKLVVKPVDLTNNKNVINSLKIAVCINEYGKFEKLNKLLLFEPKVVYNEEFSNLIDEFIEKDIFVAECMLGGESDEYIVENILKFQSLKLTGTPIFIINNKIYKGYSDYENFKKLIEKELSYTLH
ncbi:MAG: thioredoxin domain-containing protein [Bacteroidales bacterium]|jgi:protein-disulfide isomerase|nr:thioredoxin domain-containing protein [Bacteroidales bacterium]